MHNPAEMPVELELVEEPYVKASVIVPKEYVGAVMELANERRGSFDHLEYLSEERVLLSYELPLGEIVLDFYDQLKSRTRGYASFDYDLAGFRPGELTRVDILVGGEQVDALSLIVHRDAAYDRGRQLVERLRKEIPRQMFDVPVQAAIGSRVIAQRDDQGQAQGRSREVLRRRHHAQAQAAREAEEGQEADEAGGRGGGSAGGVPGRPQPRLGAQAMSARSPSVRPPPLLRAPLRILRLRHGRRAGESSTPPTWTRCSRSWRSRAHVLADRLDTIFLGGGTPTFTEPRELARLLAALPEADELTVEANPETVTPQLARLLREGGVNRVSLGAQSFRPDLLEVLERRARPDDVRRAVYLLRDAGFDNISLDLLYGIPGQSAADLERDLADALALEPEHLSCYELEAKPGTRFTHAHGDELERQAEAMEGYFETVVETLTACRVPLVRDGELLPRVGALRGTRPASPAQSRVLARAGLPGRRDRSRVDGVRSPHAQPPGARGATSPRSRRVSGRVARSRCSTRTRERVRG